MTLHRFFISPSLLENNTVILPESISFQIASVLRLKNEDQIALLDNTGFEYYAKLIKVDKKKTIAEIFAKKFNTNESSINLALYQSVITKDKFELVLQKATEIGVSEIIPLKTNRTIKNINNDSDKVKKRWDKIVQEASEQSERGKMPEVKEIEEFKEALNKAKLKGPVLLAWERGDNIEGKKILSLINKSQPISLFIGPEGGFTTEEIDYAKSLNIHLINVGPRILRSETAGIVLSFLITQL